MEQEKISWSPEAEIKVTGREFEFLARLVSIFEIPLNQLSIKDYQELFFPAVQASQDILKRMLDEGIATKGELPLEPTEGFTVLRNDAE
jgi:hypothetical protein